MRVAAAMATMYSWTDRATSIVSTMPISRSSSSASVTGRISSCSCSRMKSSRIDTSVTVSANPSVSRIANRSSWTSGSGKVPWIVARVLGGDHEERARDRTAHAVGGDLSFLHHLEQRRLGLRAPAVDLVTDQHVREDRALAERERATALVEHHDAGDVGGKEVGRELDTLPGARDRPGDRLGEARLAGARHVVEQQVPLGQQAAQRQADLVVLAAYDPSDAVDQRIGHLRDVGGHGGSVRGARSTMWEGRRPGQV